MHLTLCDPQRKASRDGVLRAAQKIGEILPMTPLLPLEIDGHNIGCKAECLQPIGAFKIRGAWHRLSDLSKDEAARGVVAFSSGNHAQGIAWAARRLGIAATIVMPADAPSAKMDNTAAYGAKIITYDRMRESREDIAAQIAERTGAIIVPSFDDPWVIEGQGSAMVEASAQLAAMGREPIDHIIACCGGGGLASGGALALPHAKITIVEPDGWDDMGQSLRSGHIIPVGDHPPATACDALQTLRVSGSTFDILSERNAQGVSVSEQEVEHAMRVAFDRLRVVVEPGGAVALAAVLAAKASITRSTVITLSGGNIDAAHFSRVIGGSHRVRAY